MRKTLLCALLCLLLTNCALVGRLQETDEAKCAPRGTDYGSPSYVRCGARLESARAEHTTPLPPARPKTLDSSTLNIPN